MKNVRQFNITDPETAVLSPETIAAWKVLARYHWKLFQVENVFIFTTRKDFIRRRLTDIKKLDTILNPRAYIFANLDKFEKHIKRTIRSWYTWQTWEMYEPYEDYLAGRADPI